MVSLRISPSIFFIICCALNCIATTHVRAAATEAPSPRAASPRAAASPTAAASTGASQRGRAAVREALHPTTPVPSPSNRARAPQIFFVGGNEFPEAFAQRSEVPLSYSQRTRNFLSGIVPSSDGIQMHINMIVAGLIVKGTQAIIETSFAYGKRKLLGINPSPDISPEDIQRFEIKEQQHLVINDEVRLHNAKQALLQEAETLKPEQLAQKKALIALEEKALDEERAHLVALKIAFAQQYSAAHKLRELAKPSEPAATPKMPPVQNAANEI